MAHRDLKPENTIVTEEGAVKLVDFGLARTAQDIGETFEGNMAGTIAYMAPEVLMGEPASPRSNLYALGVFLYEMLTERPPFKGDDPMAVISQHLHAPVVPPRGYNPAIPGRHVTVRR